MRKPKQTAACTTGATKDNSAGAPETPTGRGFWIAHFPEPADKEKTKASTDLALRPSSGAGAVAAEYLKQTFGEQDMYSLVASLEEQTSKLKANDLSECEALLLGQAQALQAIFVYLACRARNRGQAGLPLQQWDAFMRMALRAQNQCRMTLETLATIKNPPTVFARQANFAAGHQQVNNGVQLPSRARQIENQPDKLMEANNGERLDTGAAGATGGVNSDLVPVEAVDGTEDS